MHFRVMDCLAAGGFLMINETPLDDEPGGIGGAFVAGRHYGSYRMDDVAEVARRYLNDPDTRRKIAAEGRREVRAHHTWGHRAGQVLTDLGMMVDPRFAR
jgi:spore maturation protein CgeB